MSVICIHRDLFEISRELQKIDLFPVLSGVKQFDDIADANKESYYPLHFSTSYRTLYTNKVIEFPYELEKGKPQKRYYYDVVFNTLPLHINPMDIPPLASAFSSREFIYMDNSIVDLLMKSKHQIEGLFCPNLILYDPTIYMEVIFPDECEEPLSKKLGEGVKFVKIEDMIHYDTDPAFLSNLKIIKKESD